MTAPRIRYGGRFCPECGQEVARYRTIPGEQRRLPSGAVTVAYPTHILSCTSGHEWVYDNPEAREQTERAKRNAFNQTMRLAHGEE